MRALVLALLLSVAACAGSEPGPPASPDAGAPARDANPAADGAAELDAGAHDGEVSDGAASDGESSLDGGGADAGTSGDECVTDPRPGRHVFRCQGHEFAVTVPASCAQGCGLITDVHGLSMSGRMQDNNTNLAALGEQHGFIVIQPSATPRPPLSSWSESDDELVFDFIQRVVRVFAVDPARVHFTGFSQGGYMSWRFICKHSDYLASVAPAAAGSPCMTTGPDLAGCDFTSQVPAQEIDVLFMHGTMEENYIPFGCAEAQAAAVRAHWGATFTATVSTSATYRRRRYGTPRGAVFEYLTHDYYSDAEVRFVPNTRLGGHCFPGSADPGGEPGQLFSFKCEQQSDFRWGEEVIQFFLAHPRR